MSYMPDHSRQLRVAYVLLQPPQYSETFIVSELKAIQEAGASVEVFYIRRGGGKLAGIACILRALVSHPYRLLSHLRRLGASDVPRALLAAAHAITLSRDVARFRPDVVHTHFVNLPTAVAVLIAKDAQRPVTAIAHAADFLLDKELTSLVRRLQLLNQLFVISSAAAQQLAAKGVPMSKIRHSVVRAAFDGAMSGHLTPLDTPVRLITIARLIEKKGIDTSIEAVARLVDSGIDVRYDIYGDGPLRTRLARQTEARGLSSVVTFHGAVDHEKAIDGLSKSNIAILACRRSSDGDLDGIPVFLMEAASRRVPVVTTAVSGIPELVDEAAGWLVPPDDPHTLARAIKHIINDQQEAERRTRALSARLKSEFSPMLQARRLLGAWRQLVDPVRAATRHSELPHACKATSECN